MARTIGTYIIGKTLGEGASAKVKLGTNQDTGERVALKLMKSEAILGDSAARLVEREIGAMLSLKHPHVLCIKDVDYQAQYPKKNGQIVTLVLIVIEFAAGGELFEFLAATGPFDENVARTYFKQLIDGVRYCHSQNVVHRDLKPENLLLDDQFVLKIADFGFAKVCDASNCMFTQCGSPGYMAPEVMARDGYDAKKTDLWACGVILFIMIAGFPPFQKPDVSDWWFEKLNAGNGELFWKAHSRNVQASAALKQLILDILCTDPSLRFGAEQILASEWLQGVTLDQYDLQTQLHSRHTMMMHERERQKLITKQKKEQSGPENSATGKPASTIPPLNRSSKKNSGRTTLVVSAVAVAGAAVAAVALAFFSQAPGGSQGSSPPASFSFGPSVPFARALTPSANFFSVLSPSGSSSAAATLSPAAPASGVTSAAFALLVAGLTTGMAWATKTASSARRRARHLSGLEQYTCQVANYTSLESEEEADILFEFIRKWVQKQHPIQAQYSPTKFKLKATVKVGGQDISFRMQVFRYDKINSARVVELVRMDGDSIQFRALFEQLKLDLEQI